MHGCTSISKLLLIHTDQTAGEGTFNVSTGTSPIQDPPDSEDYLSASEQEDLCSPLDISIKDTFPCLDVTSLDKSEE